MAQKPVAPGRRAGRGSPSRWEPRDLLWVCRHLAAALQGEQDILRALDALSQHSPARLRGLLAAMRQSYVAGNALARGLIPSGVPSYLWGTMLAGELQRDLPGALNKLAERIETEQLMPLPRDRQLHAYSLALGRLGMMLQVGVPLVQATEAAAESGLLAEVREALMGVSRAVSDGSDLSEALARAAPDLPPMTTEMIRDAEAAGNLSSALPVVADYLLDAAGEKAPRRGKEAHHA